MSYLSAEQLIIDCLRSEIQTLPSDSILSASDIADVKTQQQVSPAIQVILHDDQPLQAEGGELNSQFVEQLWNVVVVTRNVRNRSGQSARDDAGNIINDVISILNGKHFKHPFNRMLRVKSPYRPTYNNGFFYFPMTFKVRMKTSGRERYTKPI